MIDEYLYIRLAAYLCHPDPESRSFAATTLALFDQERVLPRLDGVVACPASADLVRAVLAVRHVTEEAAREELIRLLGHPHPVTRVAAGTAMGLLGFEGAVPALLATLGRTGPDSYLNAVRALAQLQAPEGVPVLAPLALEPADGSGTVEFMAYSLAERVQNARFPLRPLMKAYRHLNSPLQRAINREMMRGTVADGPVHHDLPGAIRQAEEEQAFARGALWEMGEGSVLAAVRGLSTGNPERAVALRDERLFETLALALLRRPGTEGERTAGRAAMAGLEALGSGRALALLEGIERAYRLPVYWPLRRESRAAAGRLRQRLGLAGGELLPSASPDGGGREGVPSPPPSGAGTEAIPAPGRRR
jgi:hypothetical protein